MSLEQEFLIDCIENICSVVDQDPAGTSGIGGALPAFDASLSTSTYQDNAPVQQNALLIQCCIKY